MEKIHDDHFVVHRDLNPDNVLVMPRGAIPGIRELAGRLSGHINGIYKIGGFRHAFGIADTDNNVMTESRKPNVGVLP
jgi:hypothetical protein